METLPAKVRSLSRLGLLLAVSGCYEWHAASVPLPSVAARARESHGQFPVRVRLRDGRLVDLYEPRVSHDTLSGFPRQIHSRTEPPVKIPTAEIAMIET